MKNLRSFGIALMVWFTLSNVNAQQCISYVENKFGGQNNQLQFNNDRSNETFRVMSNIENPQLFFKSGGYQYGRLIYGVSLSIDQTADPTKIRQIGNVNLNYDMFDATAEYLDTLIIKDLNNPIKTCVIPVKINYYSSRVVSNLVVKATECTKNEAQISYRVQAPGTLNLYKFGKLYLTKHYDINFIVGTKNFDTIKNLSADTYYIEFKLRDTANTYYFSPNYSPNDPTSYKFYTGKGTLPNSLVIQSVKDTVCVGGILKYTANYPGGTWYLSDPANANVELTNDGLVKANKLGAGYEFIYYTLCQQTAVVSVIIKSAPNPVTLSGASAFCIGTSGNLNPSIQGGRWISSVSSVASVNNGTVLGLKEGKSIIRYELGNVGCLATSSKEITVEAMPTATISGPAKICWNGKAMFRASVAGGVWEPVNSALILSSSQGLFRNGIKPAVDNFKSGVAYTLTSKSGACVNKLVKNVYVRNVISPSVTVSAPKTSIKLNEIVMATATTSNPAVGAWSSTTTLVSATINSNTKTAQIKGLRVGSGANVVYFADDATTGCRFSGWLGLNVLAAQSVVTATTDASTRIGVNVYPNPSNGNISLENIGGAHTISLVDMTGRTLKSVPVTAERMTVNFSGVQAGKYLIQITGEQMNETRTVVIE